MEILKRGRYISIAGDQVNIMGDLHHAKSHSILYTPYENLLAKVAKEKGITSSTYTPLEIELRNETTFQAAQYLINQGHDDVLCLNFASAKNPGGGFLRGSQAQEECLARTSGLYHCLKDMTEMYDTNRRGKSCLYTHYMVYSPRVPVFRNEETNQLLNEPYQVSIISAPAVNAGEVRRKEKDLISEIESTMSQRIHCILCIAALHGHSTLVLGAWGCGVFVNDPHAIARLFQAHLLEDKLFKGVFRKVVFAVSDRTKEQKIYGAFDQVLRPMINNGDGGNYEDDN